ncbi:fatty acid-binding protein, brain [Lingula anatina]|uniref:Fatty acid-binding protein, brain n=1 Tax=Lingula anatina TaxID=7574 RepID=A0A1S3HK41_LINAN|nr:fatty acid-binding protein, brain [Lingula anatina]|eukprot:XP_013386387.1 fatty acid-binding protein, brain [Lingula anatina]
MEPFLGKWQSLPQNNVEFGAFLKATGMSQEQVEGYQKMNSEHPDIVTLTQEGDQFKTHTVCGPVVIEHTFKLGQTFVETMPPENKQCKMTFNLVNGALEDDTEMEGVKMKHSRTVSGDDMTMVMSAGGKSCIRMYKRI